MVSITVKTQIREFHKKPAWPVPAFMRFFRLLGLTALVVSWVVSGCGSESEPVPGPTPSNPAPTQNNPPTQSPTPNPNPTPNPTPTPSPTPSPGPSPTPGWRTLYEEHFETLTTLFENGVPGWNPDGFQFTDRFADGGAYFQALGVTPPTAFRAEWPFGRDGWLTAAGYSRSNATDLSSLITIVADPAGGANHVLKIASPVHTDGMVVRPSLALPGTRYRVCLRVGYAAFGDGDPAASNLNGYLGGERSEPWFNDDSTLQNGFYWLTILDDVPRPHNNVWIHHHRKVVIDSDNNKEAWTQIWTGTSFVNDGRHPIMMFAYDKGGVDLDRTGHPLLSWSNGTLQPSGFVRAVDAYKDNTWYSACIERNTTHFVLSIAGDFKYGGLQNYVGLIPISAVYRAESGVPDFFMFGDPHNNYYRGQVFYDDVKLEQWID